MSRALALTQKQIRAICAGARKEGRMPVIVVGNMVIKLVPDDQAETEKSTGEVDRKRRIRL